MSVYRASVAGPVREAPPRGTEAATGAAEAGATGSPAELASLVVDLQARGLRVEVPLERRRGGAGPSDSAMLWAGTRLAGASAQRGPRFYDLTTADGVPYWKIGLLHLDSFASTVVQTCAYWGNENQCRFCGIEVSLDAGRTIVKKTPEQLAEVAVAARELDGAVDATLTTGSSNGVDRGARYVARCAQAVQRAAGLPVEGQFEPARDLGVLHEVGEIGVDSVGIHVESFDPDVLARVAPAKARTGIERYFETWTRAVDVFGRGQVST